MTATRRAMTALALLIAGGVLVPARAAAQRALVYCPARVDASGCNALGTALAADAAFAGVDRAYDGTDGTIDLGSADLAAYAVFIVPSLAVNEDGDPYALLRTEAVAGRIRATFPGRAVVWSGTPDLGSSNLEKKEALIRNLAHWAAADAVSGRGAGIVAFQDVSPEALSRYTWLAQISALAVSANAMVSEVYANVEARSATGVELLAWNGLQLGYTNMASGGLVAPSGAMVEATGGRTTNAVLVTIAGQAPGEGIATITTDKEDYAPGETVTVTGSGWLPGETVSMKLHEEPVVHGDRTLTAVADSTGTFVNSSFVVEEHDLGVRFVLSATGGTSGRTAQATFTDGRVVVAATLNGIATVTVSTSALIAAQVTVNITASGNVDWGSTRWTIGTVTACVNHPNHTGANNQFIESFQVTAPGAIGIYDATFEAFSNDNCGGAGGGNTPITLTNAVTVVPANAAPVAVNDAATTNEDAPVTVSVLANDTDDGPAANLTVTALTQPAPVAGSVAPSLDNKSVVYTPAPNFNGVATFTYKANDGVLSSVAAATVTITVNPVNDPPTLAAIPDKALKWGNALSFALAGADIDVPAQTLTYTVTGGPSGNDASATGGIFSWTPDEGDVGTSTFTVTVSDGTASASQNFGVEVQRHATAIVYSGNVSGTVFGPVTFMATLTDTDAGNAPLSGRTIGFTLGAFSTTAVTQSGGAAGLATASATIPSGTGATSVVATYTPGASEGYLASSVTTPFTLNRAGVTVSMADATVTYDGSPKPLIATVTDATSAAVTSPAVTYAYLGTGSTSYSSAAAPEDAGTYQVTASYPGNADYLPGSTAASLTIGPRQLTVSATGVDRPYDGTANATVTLADDRVAGDALITAYASASFADKAVGTAKPISVTGITLAGADAGNYAFNTTASAEADISALTVTVAATAVSRVYDGTTVAAFALGAISGAIGGDDVATSGGAAAFADKHAGTGKLVTITGVTLTGADAGNYLLGGPITATADISPRPLAVTANGVGRVYDATTNATVTFTHDGIVTDDLSFTYAAAFLDKYAGIAKPISITAFALTGADAANYVATPPTSTSATITPAPLTATITAGNKTYDGTTSATIVSRTPVGVLGTDDVTVNGGTATFADKHAGTGKTVSATGLALGGADGGNYDFGGTASTTADIEPRALAVTATGVDKVYDATTAATVTFADDRISGDVFTVTGSASFADKNVGIAKPVSVTGIALAGSDAGNYTPNTTTTASATISQAPLTATVAVANKVYDQGTGATITTRTPVGVLGTDDISLAGGTAVFADKHAATSKPVTVTGLVLGGGDAGNYAFDGTAATAADITPRPLVATATGIDRVYDGTTTATVTFSDDRIAGDVLTFAYSAAFADKNVGTDKPVSVTGITLGGADAGNYAPNTTETSEADITPRPLVVSATGHDRDYDGTTVATVTLADDRVAGDQLILAYAAAAFNDKHAGSGKPISVTGIAVTGTDAGNYSANTTASATASIAPRALAVTAHGVNKVYDGSTAAEVTFTDDRIAGDVFTIAYAAAFADKDVGAAKVVSVSGITLGGADGGNYAPNTTEDAAADITPRPITVTADPQTRVYGDADPALTYEITAGSLVAGEGFTGALTRAPGELVAGSPYAITQGSLTAGTNYDLAFAPAALTITRAPLTVVVHDKSKIQGGMNPTLTGTVSGHKLGDVITATYSTTAGELSPPATYPITAALVDPAGKLPNYTVANTPGTLTVTPNAAPVLGALTGLTTAPVQIGTSVSVGATFTDADPVESTPYTTTINWGDGSDLVSANPTAPGAISGTHAYATPGVYVVTVSVKDKISGFVSQSFEYVVVYDPNGGFVTGGGWIMSPAGAYVAEPALTGKATFGFVAKYKKGQQAPDGNTEFQFHAASLTFKSTSYEWLVVAGLKAQYKGVGTLNGVPGYRFMLTAIDGDGATRKPDRFRMKIMDGSGAVVYDNQIGLPDNGDPTTTLSGGSIVVHDK